MLNKNGIIAQSVFLWLSMIIIVSMKVQLKEQHHKCLCVDYHGLNILLSLVVKAHSKAQGVLSCIFLPKIDELYTMLKSPTVYFSVYCTSGYHHIDHSPEMQTKSTFVTTIGKCELMKIPFGLGQAPVHFQKLINEVLKGLLFSFGYLDDILNLVKTWNSTLNI